MNTKLKKIINHEDIRMKLKRNGNKLLQVRLKLNIPGNEKRQKITKLLIRKGVNKLVADKKKPNHQILIQKKPNIQLKLAMDLNDDKFYESMKEDANVI